MRTTASNSSPDLGKTWTQLSIKCGELGGMGVFSDQELVIATWQGIRRSADAGTTWNKVCALPLHRAGPGLRRHRLLAGQSVDQSQGVDASLVISKDKGQTWQEAGQPLEDTMFCCGPFFGKDAKHLVVATLTKIVESTDGVRNVDNGGPLSARYPAAGRPKNGCGFPSLGYDAMRDVFYVFLVNMKKWPDGQVWRFTR